MTLFHYTMFLQHSGFKLLSFKVLQFLADYSLLEEDFVEQLEAVSNRIDRDF